MTTSYQKLIESFKTQQWDTAETQLADILDQKLAIALAEEQQRVGSELLVEKLVAIICERCGAVWPNSDESNWSIKDDSWKCPRCGNTDITTQDRRAFGFFGHKFSREIQKKVNNILHEDSNDTNDRTKLKCPKLAIRLAEEQRRVGKGLLKESVLGGVIAWWIYLEGLNIVGGWILGVVIVFGGLLASALGSWATKTSKWLRESARAREIFEINQKLSPGDVARVVGAAKEAYARFSPRVKSQITTLSKQLQAANLESESGRNRAAAAILDLNKTVGKDLMGESFLHESHNTDDQLQCKECGAIFFADVGTEPECPKCASPDWRYMPESVNEASLSLKCRECGKNFKSSNPDPKCPKCGGYDIDLGECSASKGLHEANCVQCGKPQNPVQSLVGKVCLACAKKKHKKVTG